MLVSVAPKGVPSMKDIYSEFPAAADAFPALTSVTHRVPEWTSPAAITTDQLAFRGREQAFDGCRWDRTGGCTWGQGGWTAVVSVLRYVTLPPRRALGVCGASGKSHISSAASTQSLGRTLDERVFVPIDVAQSAFFGHFMDCLMPKLVYVLAMRRSTTDLLFRHGVLIYFPKEYESANTYSVLRALNVSWTHDYPVGRLFRTAIWVCHTPPMSPEQASSMKAELTNAFPPGGGTRDCLVVFASRARGTRNGRHPPNEAGAIAFLMTRRCVVNVIYGDEPLPQLAQTLGSASLLIGEHGTALYNMAFLPKGSTVLELDGWYKYTIFYTMASAYGLQYAWLDHSTGNKEIDLDKLNTLLTRIGF